VSVTIIKILIVVVSSLPVGTATWYGGEEFIGRHHAAHWHKETPVGAPAVVDYEYLGCAAPIDIPFGTQLIFTRVSACKGYSSPFDGKSVVCTVVDRKARYTIPDYYDLWPAAAQGLGFGPGYSSDDGCVTVQVQRVLQRESIIDIRLRRIQTRYEGARCSSSQRINISGIGQ